MIIHKSGLGQARALISCVSILFRHTHRRLRAFFLLLFVAFLVETLWTITRSTPSTRMLKGSGGSDLTELYKQRVYIAALHHNDEKLLLDHWIPALLDLVRHWEPDNLYVSIVESGSVDGTKDALKALDFELYERGIERNIQLSNKTHEDEVTREPETNEPGWIQTPRGKLERRRLSYLAEERNKAMTKIKELAYRENNPRGFDKVLWLNDIIFNVRVFWSSASSLILTSLCRATKSQHS